MLVPLLLLAASLPHTAERSGAAGLVIGDYRTVVDIRAAEHFPMQSVYKFPIGMAVLSAVDRGALKPDQKVLVRKDELVALSLHSPLRDAHPAGNFEATIRELIELMVTESDGTACDVLLRVIGGAHAVDDYLRSLGVNEVKVVTPEAEMARDREAQYRNWATPRGMVQLLTLFYEGKGLSPESRKFLLNLMTKTTSGPLRIRGLLPAGTVVAHKTGSSGTVSGFTAATNDAGLITLPDGKVLALAVFVSDSHRDAAARDQVIAEIAHSAWLKASTF